MENEIKSALSNLPDDKLLEVYKSNIDLDYPLKKDVLDRIKYRTLKKLGLHLNTLTPSHKKVFVKPIKLVLCICIAVMLLFIAVCSVSEPFRDRIIKYYSGDVTSNDLSTIQAHLYTKEYDIIKYPIDETIDFSTFDYSLVDKIIIKSGITGEEKTFYDIEEIILAVKQIKAYSPISSRGYSGFSYNIKMYNGDEQIYKIGLVSFDEENLSVYYGIFEEVEQIKYMCLYKTEINCKEFLTAIDVLFE